MGKYGNEYKKINFSVANNKESTESNNSKDKQSKCEIRAEEN